MDRILVSACLIGWPVRWDGGAKTLHHPLLTQWAEEGRLVPLCPETAGGLAVPRPAAEIESGADAAAVLAGRARIVDAAGGDHSAAFREGARVAVATARVRGCRYALFTEGSPSCGVELVADGSFSGKRKIGEGVTAAALRAAGIAVFAATDVEKLAEQMAKDASQTSATE
jgi:uncharacterized protein YbbK (DUF523 family)